MEEPIWNARAIEMLSLISETYDLLVFRYPHIVANSPYGHSCVYALKCLEHIDKQEIDKTLEFLEKLKESAKCLQEELCRA